MPLGGSPQLLTEEDRRRMQMAAGSQLSAGGGPLAPSGDGLRRERETNLAQSTEIRDAARREKEREEAQKYGSGDALGSMGDSMLGVGSVLAASGAGLPAAAITAGLGGILHAFGLGIGKGS